jgi:hypothetical protein
LSAVLQILLNLLVHALVELFTGISITLFIEVVLVGGQRLFTPPFHVLHQALQASLDLLFAGCRLVDVPDFACDVPF